MRYQQRQASQWAMGLALLVALGCSRRPSEVQLELDVRRALTEVPPAPPRPERCREVSPEAPGVPALQALLDAAAPGEAFCLADGQYAAPIRLRKGLTLWGGTGARLRSSGKGTTVQVEAGASLLGLSVQGSGRRVDQLDAAVRVEGDDAVVRGVRISEALFGILVEKSKRVRLVENHVLGQREVSLGMRGDAIRLWESHSGVVERNVVEDARDIVVWYSSDNRIVRNVARHGRYGTHFMYSHRNHVEGNFYLGNEVGIFVMYSRDLELVDNVMAHALGAAGMGLGLKESGSVVARNNRFLYDTIGVFLDNSPLALDEHNLFEANEFRMCDAAVSFLSSGMRNAFDANSFRDNHVQVRVEGGGDALEVAWNGNHFDDYAGFDLDGDGVGDVPYELKSLSSTLVDKRPELAFFSGAPALGLLRLAGDVLPMLAPKPILRDDRPRLAPDTVMADRAQTPLPRAADGVRPEVPSAPSAPVPGDAHAP